MRNRLLDNAPLLRIVVCMIIGIIIAHHVALPVSMLPVLIGMVVIALLLWKYKYMQSLSILLCFLFMGMFLMQRQQTMPDDLQQERLWHGQHSPAEEKLYERMVSYWGERYKK